MAKKDRLPKEKDLKSFPGEEIPDFCITMRGLMWDLDEMFLDESISFEDAQLILPFMEQGLKNHLKRCRGCREYHQVRQQKKQL